MIKQKICRVLYILILLVLEALVVEGIKLFVVA